MVRQKAIYTCQNCGHQTPKWMGKCSDCQKWNTLIEEAIISEKKLDSNRTFDESGSSPSPITEIESKINFRLKTKIKEFDRVLGGGLVEGSLILIGGDPGIGKSTIVLQALDAISQFELPVLYVSGEESLEQTKLRAERLNVGTQNLFLLSETNLEKIINQIQKLNPKVLAIDSIQTVYTSEIESAPGSVSQVREVVARLMYLAKRLGIATFIIGHVTKEGSIAGPRVLEHMVDSVLYCEVDSGKSYRILRAVKNRFGSTNEIGVFEMNERGLEGVENPSELFLSERPINTPGSAVVASVEGTRPMLVEIQSLVSPTTLVLPRRTTMGVDQNRVSLLVAVLEKRAGLQLFNHDIYVNVAGGLRIQEPAVDLGVCAAVASSFLNKNVDSSVMCLGEVGLTGEIRAVSHVDIRSQEAFRLGFKQCILPKSNLKKLKTKAKIEFLGISTVDELMDALFQ